MEVTNEPEGCRHVSQPAQAVLQRANVVGYLSGVSHGRLVGCFDSFGLEEEELSKIRHRAFDTAGQYRLAAQKGVDQKMWIG